MVEKQRQCNPPRGPHDASHHEWGYRAEAVVWVEKRPIKPNMIDFARQMSLWTQQKVRGLPLRTKLQDGVVGELSNPYSYSLGALSLVIGTVINESYEFSESTAPVDPIDAEVQRIRFEAELTIHAARFCEAAIKQMLYCTQFPEKMYGKASMGQLLARDCDACRKAGKAGHDISLLGSLAHRFFLCHEIDGCAIDHLQLVARRRNQEAAHSESQSVHPRSAEQSRKHLAESINEIGFELGHMCKHIGAIEEKMIAETNLFIRSYPKPSSWDELARIPVRDLQQYPRESTDGGDGASAT